jgi:hypothetical protein
MAPLLIAVGVCALLFETLAMVSRLCPPGRFLSLPERPG